MAEPGSEHPETPPAQTPTQPPAADPEKKRKLIVLLVAGGAFLIILIIANLSSRRRQQAARALPQPVTISRAETKATSEMLPLVTIGGQGKGGQGFGLSDQDLELERLTKELKVLQARTAVVQAQQNLADLRVAPKAQEQRVLAVAFVKKGGEAGQDDQEQTMGPVGNSGAGASRAVKNPAFSEVTETQPSDSPKPFLLKMGTLLDAVLVNKLVSDNYTSPVMAMVDRPYYDPLTRKLLVPAGTRILGKAEAVKYQTASRLAITFETFQFPNGVTYTVKPDEQALEGLGIFGLQDRVNRHTARILFTAGLVGILTGWNVSQVQAGGGINGAYDGTDLMRIQANNSMSKTAEQMLSPFLNAVPTITVDEGHRMKIWISRDIPMDAYREAPNE